MSVTREKNGEILIVSAAGQINSANAAELETCLLEWVQEGEHKWVLDMAGVEYISSAGLRVVLLLAKRLKQNGGHLVLCSLQPHVLEVFDISGFLSILDVADSRDAALGRHVA
ncbi:MAG TPA: STAS domain-containing protein [Burkholderiaceae bacterium]|nr:STAS domain-containing protein [Burkholderiaceae bacterium]